jgi:arsenate reductase
MKTIFHLTNCNTCQRIIKELDPGPEFVMQDIRNQPLTVAQLETLKKLAGSYEALFSRRAKLYRERGLNNEQLTEDIYRELLLEHYTFLQRPVVVNNDQIFVGSSKKTVAAAKASL